MECIRAVVKHDSSKIGCQERVASPTSEYKCLISCSQLYGNIFFKSTLSQHFILYRFQTPTAGNLKKW